MSEPDDAPLQDRIAALETRLSQLQQEVERLNRRLEGVTAPHAKRPERPRAGSEAGGPAPVRPAVQAEPRTPSEAAERVRKVLKSEDWLNKIGIGLLLFGLAFLFKYSIDQGWLGPPVRVAFGVALGLFLLVAGLRLRPTRKRYGQVLLGGGLATFYVTIFAAYQLYGLVGYPVAFGAMAAVTLLAFALAVRQKDPILAVVATLGGLGTPFMLYTGGGSLPGLVTYTCAVLSAAIGIYLYRGWRSLLWSAVVGGWLVFLIGWAEVVFNEHPVSDEAAFLLGVGFCWLAFGVLPALRAVWHRRQPDRWAVPPLDGLKGTAFAQEPALFLAVLAPLVTLFLSVEVLDLPDAVFGLALTGVTVLYAGTYAGLRREGMPGLASSHGVAAAALLAISWFYLFDGGSLQLTALALEGAALHLLARSLTDRGLRLTGHLLCAVVAFWLASRLLEQEGARPVLLNEMAVADLAVLLLGFTAAWTFRPHKLRATYALAAYVGLLGWFWRDLVLLPNGQAYVSVAWGLCAIALLALGWWRDADLVRNTGLGTLLVVVGKLFVVDLAKLDAVWRILLFLGFGGLLLLLSYFFPSLWRPGDEAREEARKEQEEDAGQASI